MRKSVSRANKAKKSTRRSRSSAKAKKSTRRSRSSAKAKKSTRRSRSSAKAKKSTRRSAKRSSRSKKSKSSKKCRTWLRKMLKSIPEIKPKQIEKFMAIFKKYKRKFSFPFLGGDDKKTDCSICFNEMNFEIDENNLKNLNIDISRLTDVNYIKTIDLTKLNNVLKDEVFLGCGHCFHRKCISRWSDDKPVCPLCRGPIQNIGTLKPSMEMASAISEIMEDVEEEADLKKNTTRIEQKQNKNSLLGTFAKLFAIGAALGGGLLSGSGSSNSSQVQKMLDGPSARFAIGYSEGSSSDPSDFSSPTPFPASNLYDRPNNTSSTNHWTLNVPYSTSLSSNLNNWKYPPTLREQDEYWNTSDWVTGGGGGGGGGGGDSGDPPPPSGNGYYGAASASSSAIDNAVAPKPTWGSGFLGTSRLLRDAILGTGYDPHGIAHYAKWYKTFQGLYGRPPRMGELSKEFRENIENNVYGDDVEAIITPINRS